MTRDIGSLSFQQIRTFCGVFEHGGYAGAEQVLDLNVPTMWEQVKALESIYAVKLFRRSGRNIEPTSAGRLLYQMLKPLLVNLESTLEVVAEQNGGAPKEIRLVTGVRMVLEELGEPLRAFRQQYPAVKLRLMTADNRVAQQFVHDNRADMALMIEPPRDMLADGIVCHRLYPIDYLAALPRRHRLSRKSELTLKDLLSEPLIVGTPDTIGRQMLEQACFRLGLTTELKIAAETDNSAITLACVRAGLGVGMIAGRPGGKLTRHVTTRSLAADIGQVHVVAAFPVGRQLTQPLRSLLELCRGGTQQSQRVS